jgi:hypothetical protein
MFIPGKYQSIRGMLPEQQGFRALGEWVSTDIRHPQGIGDMVATVVAKYGGVRRVFKETGVVTD